MRCQNELGGDGGDSDWPWLQMEISDSILGSGNTADEGMICCTR